MSTQYLLRWGETRKASDPYNGIASAYCFPRGLRITKGRDFYVYKAGDPLDTVVMGCVWLVADSWGASSTLSVCNDPDKKMKGGHRFGKTGAWVVYQTVGGSSEVEAAKLALIRATNEHPDAVTLVNAPYEPVEDVEDWE